VNGHIRLLLHQDVLAPPFTAQRVGRRRSRRDGAFAGGRPDTGGVLRVGTRKAWPLLCRAGSHPLGVQSESDAGSHAGASWGDGGVVRLPRFRVDCGDGILLTLTGGVSFSGDDHEQAFDNG
jgi:hypothetical protein